MKLTALRPRWLGNSEGRPGLGIAFDCPCPRCDARPTQRAAIALLFENPTDGGPKAPNARKYWKRIGDTFETLSLEPGIDRSEDGHFIGFVSRGRVAQAGAMLGREDD